MDRWLAIARLRFRSLFRRSDVERELDDELQYHVDRQAEENRARGMSHQAARRAALVALGGVEHRKEQSRDARGTRAIEDFLRDVRFSVRSLRRSASFTTVTVLTLAVGIGATTAVFSVLDAVMFRSLPVRDPDGLVIVQRMARAPDGNIAPRPLQWPAFLRLSEDSSVLERAATLASVGSVVVRSGDRTEPLEHDAMLVSGDFFPMLGLNAQIGRLIDPTDDRVPGGSPVVVLGYRYWLSRFGANEEIIGKSIDVNGVPLTVVGVAPSRFTGVSVGSNPDIYVPMLMAGVMDRSSVAAALGPSRGFLHMMARLKPGVSPERASHALTAVYVRERVESAGGSPDSATLQQLRLNSLRVLPGGQGLAFARTVFGGPLVTLMTIVSIVLFIACANIASLLVARASAKRHEIGVRLSMGASRTRLVRQLLTESLVLALAGGILGLVVSRFGTRLLVLMLGDGRSPLTMDVQPDARILTFALTASLLTAVLVGLVPAVIATRPDVTPLLRAARGAIGAREQLRLGRWLVVGQMALSLILLAGTGLFVRGLIALQRMDLGFMPEKVVVMHIDPRRSGYSRARLASLYEQVLLRLRSVPGVSAGALADITPLSGSSMSINVIVQGHELAPGERAEAWLIRATPEYFRAIGQPLVAGAGLAPRAGTGDIVVNEAFARELASNDALGGRVARLRSSESTARFTMQVTGVVKDAVLRELRERRQPTVYLPFLGDTTIGSAFIVVRSTSAPNSVMQGVREVLREIDPRLEVLRATTLAGQVDAAMVRERLVATLATFFGVLALLLAALGLYGLASHGVARRTRELGLRMALGAPRVAVAVHVLREALVPLTIGVAIGLPVSWLAATATTRLVIDVPPIDAVTMISCVGALVVVALVASYLPARRASRIDPIIALRAD